MSVLGDKIQELRGELERARRRGDSARIMELSTKIEKLDEELKKQKQQIEQFGTITPVNMPKHINVSAIPQESKEMIVFGTRKGEDYGNELYKGDLEQCKEWCKNAVPEEYDKLDICRSNGVIEWRLVRDGMPFWDFDKLIDEVPEIMSKAFTR